MRSDESFIRVMTSQYQIGTTDATRRVGHFMQMLHEVALALSQPHDID